MAAYRARESERTDRLFDDPYAARLAGQEGFKCKLHASIPVRRTVFFDNHTRNCYQDGVRQFVLLGAGMDTRAFRMALAGAHVFEVDKAELFAVKEKLLKGVKHTAAKRTVLSFEFGARHINELGAELAEKGFNKDEASAWLLEGLLMYLTPKDAEALIRAIAALTGLGSRVVHDAVNEVSAASRMSVCGAPFLSGHDDWLERWRELGFAEGDALDVDDVEEDRLNRNITIVHQSTKKNGVDQRTFFVSVRRGSQNQARKREVGQMKKQGRNGY